VANGSPRGCVFATSMPDNLMRALESPIRSETNGCVVGGDRVTPVVRPIRVDRDRRRAQTHTTYAYVAHIDRGEFGVTCMDLYMSRSGFTCTCPFA
jgi:hypothetical protein